MSKLHAAGGQVGAAASFAYRFVPALNRKQLEVDKTKLSKTETDPRNRGRVAIRHLGEDVSPEGVWIGHTVAEVRKLPDSPASSLIGTAGCIIVNVIWERA